MAALSESKAMYRAVIDKDIPMRTRDSVTLYADVYRPGTIVRFPGLVLPVTPR